MDPALLAPSTPLHAPDPLVRLVAFHRGIRVALDAFDDVAALARVGLAEPLRARALAEFFRGPLRAHDEDERLVLLPALLAAPHPVRVARLLAAAAREHAVLERLVLDALVDLDGVAWHGACARADALSRASVALRAVLEPHLAREEEELFPLARLLLDDGALRDVQRFIDARRERKA